MSGHTPGQWELRDVAGAGLQIWAHVDLGREKSEATDRVAGPRLQPVYELSLAPRLMVGQDGRAYVMLSYESWRQFPTVAFDEMQRANARLIAAAPDLLAACHLALGLLPTADDAPTAFQRQRIAKIESAVAKAEGR